MTGSGRQRSLLDAARAGDESAYAALVQPLRGELHAHCYRMLGSVHDADDALQDALVSAWRGLARFQARSSVRTWLYTITTNACLLLIRRRPQRVLPIDYGPPVDRDAPTGEPLVESVWVEPYPDEAFGLPDTAVAPEARYELRESVELAFVAALQHLPATQRAVLILREVLGFSAKEVAEALDTTVASVNSALQRARASIEERVPDQTQQVAARSLGDEAVSELVGRYVDAWERCDVDAFVSLLTEDATFAMPPLASWYRGREEIRAWAAESSLSGDWRWRTVAASANAQPALGFYAWDDPEGAYLAFALNVLTLRGRQVSDVIAFIVRTTDVPDPSAFGRWPEQAADPERLAAAFGRFGLPARLA